MSYRDVEELLLARGIVVIPIEIYKAVFRVVSLVWIIVLVKVKKLKM